MKNIILFISVSLASGLLLTNTYNSLIDAKAWGSNIPDSIAAAREYFKNVNPGDFFRVFSPLNQLLALTVLLLFWKSVPGVRLHLGIALILYAAVDVFTFSYFYPRNDIMFVSARLNDIDALTKAWHGWNTMNWLRSAMLLAGLFFSCLSLHKVYLSQQAEMERAEQIPISSQTGRPA